MKTPENFSVLVVEDDALIAENIKMMLEDFGYDISDVCYNYKNALQALQQKSFDILLTDIDLGKGTNVDSGLQLALHVNETKKCPVIFLTALSDKNTVAVAAGLHPAAYLVKPINAASLYCAIQIAFENFKTLGSASLNAPTQTEYLFIKQGTKQVKVMWKDVYQLETVKNYVKLHTRDSAGGLLVRSSLLHVLQHMLPAQHKNRFLKINRAEAIDKSIIEKVHTNYVKTSYGEFKISIDLSAVQL